MKNEQSVMNYKVKTGLIAMMLALACTTPVSGQYPSYYSGGNDREKVAVYVTGQVPAINKIVGNRLVSTIVKQGKYTAVERSAEFLAQLLKEHEYECSGHVCVEQISRVGKQFGVDRICAAEITGIEGRYYITVRLINVVTAEIIDTEEAYSSGNIDNLTATTNRLAATLFDIPYVRKQKGVYLTAEALYLNQYGWGGTAAIGYRFNEYVALGAGGGYAMYAGENFSGKAIPVFAGLRVNILPYVVSPYVAVAAGACFDAYANTDTYTDNGRTITETSEHDSVYGYYNVAAGLYLRCSDGFAVHAGAGYNNIVKTFAINAGIAITFN
jgi:hypothetical protein